MSQTWIEKVIPKIIQTLGSDIEEERYEYSELHGLLSDQYYVSIMFKKKGKNEKLSLFLKRPFAEQVLGNVINMNSQFHNEILFYHTYARSDENFPRCFYTDDRPPNDSVIALENVSDQGYGPYPQAYDAPLEYILAAMREMGRFHGKGYVMKELQQDKFFDIVKQLQKTKYFSNAGNEERDFYQIFAMRVVNHLRSQNYDTGFCDKMTDLFLNVHDKVLAKTEEPVEPLAVLCHGDFTLCNILFKREDDEQLRAMLIDFADFKYATPVVDLATFLCMSCSNELSKNKFFEIMRAYHDVLKKYLSDAGVWDAEKYSYDAFLDDYKRGAVYGFAIASFFLPIVMGYTKFTPEMVQTMGLIEIAKRFEHSGGDKMAKILADMLLHLKDLGCLKEFL